MSLRSCLEDIVFSKERRGHGVSKVAPETSFLTEVRVLFLHRGGWINPYLYVRVHVCASLHRFHGWRACLRCDTSVGCAWIMHQEDVACCTRHAHNSSKSAHNYDLGILVLASYSEFVLELFEHNVIFWSLSA